MITAKVKMDDSDMIKKLINQKAKLFVGYTDRKKYEAIDEPFYANVAKPNTKGSFGEKVGKPRRFGRQKERTAAEVAAFNEFGGGHTPERPFMRHCFAQRSSGWNKFMQDRVPQDLDIVKTFWKLGDRIKADLSDTVRIWTRPPNAPSTIKNKGFNNPLVDSGNMGGDFIEIEVNGVVGE